MNWNDIDRWNAFSTNSRIFNCNTFSVCEIQVEIKGEKRERKEREKARRWLAMAMASLLMV